SSGATAPRPSVLRRCGRRRASGCGWSYGFESMIGPRKSSAAEAGRRYCRRLSVERRPKNAPGRPNAGRRNRTAAQALIRGDPGGSEDDAMLLILLSYLAGALTILSPCVLPVLPFVFARAGQPFVKSGLPLLVGMALTFASVATLAAVGGGWAVQANLVGRWIALAVMAVLGLTLVFPALADRLTRPLVALGSRLTEKASAEQQAGGGVWPSFLLGVATGLLWAPCAGPILGLILTGAALQGASVGTTLLLLAYAAGAATSLALALLVG